MASRESDNADRRFELSGPTALGDAVAAMRRFAMDQGLAPRDGARLCIIVEELVTNIFEHGGMEDVGPVGLAMERAGSAVRIAIDDGGQPFDPASASDPGTVPARGGGAGLRLVRAWAQILGYERSAGRNRLELLVPLSG